jgi:LL-diaminopimelate aminotransferase
MARINPNYQKLQSRYLFSEIAKKTKEFITQHPTAVIIKLGIGDTTLPLTPIVIKAFHESIDELAKSDTYKGYGPEQGYDFLRNAIAQYEYQARQININADEIFISDGSKCDTGNILDIFGPNKIAVSDPAYPVYVDTNVMAGNTGKSLPNGQYEGLVYLACTDATGFNPSLPTEHVDLIYLVYPNNPTGTVMTKSQLQAFVEYARMNKSILLFDAAYERYITDPTIPHSIYEIEGAREVAIEFRSFSKTAGFTGVRCAFTVIPQDLKGYDDLGQPQSIHSLWNRRHTTKFNGVSYPVQKAAAAIYTHDGRQEVNTLITYYLENAKIIRDGFTKAGFTCYGGINSPYIWVKTPKSLTSWAFFDLLLNRLNIVGTPGSGFGPSGEGYFRLTAFGKRENTLEAMRRIQAFDWKIV